MNYNHASYGRGHGGFSNGTFSHDGVIGSCRGRGGGKFANFLCQIYLKFGHTTKFFISGLMFLINLMNQRVLLI